MPNKIIITLDQGSSSSRALAVDSQGRVVASAATPLHTFRPQAQVAELDAAKLLQGQLAVLQEVFAKTTNYTVSALAVATQRSTVVFWDKQTGQSLAPVLSWQDGRAMQISQGVSLPQEQIHQLTGLYNTPFYSAAKIAWALQHIPAVQQAAQADKLCVGPVASYLIWHLTGGQVFACDPTLAQRMLLMNIHTLDWEDTLLEQFHIPRNILPHIQATTDPYGSWKQIPITVCVGDQQAALTALRVSAGNACINYGTGAFFMHHTGTQCQLIAGLLTSVAAQSSLSSSSINYLLEGPVNACSTVFNWLQSLGIQLDMQQLDKLVSQAKNPVKLLPALGGLGAPYWDFTLSPIIAGMMAQTTAADIAAGAIQAIANLLADIVYYAASHGIKSQNIKVSGGFAHHASLLQAQADILQQNLLPCTEKESTAIGAALLAAQQMQWDTAQWHTVEMLPQITPRLSAPQAQQQYQTWRDFISWCKQAK